MRPMFEVTKRITDGPLVGMTVVETTSVEFEVGEVITPSAWTGSGYVVEAVARVA